jgi:hypothetical protein
MAKYQIMFTNRMGERHVLPTAIFEAESEEKAIEAFILERVDNRIIGGVISDPDYVKRYDATPVC